MDNTTLLQLFFTFIFTQQCLSLNTAYTYYYHAKIFCNYLDTQSINISDINDKTILNFFSSLDTNIKKRTRNIYWASLTSFGTFLKSKNIIKDNSFSRFDRAISEPKRKPDYFTPNELDLFFKQISIINNDLYIEIRDLALFNLIYASGLRCSEACNLLFNNVHLTENTVLVNGKGSKERFVPFTNRCKTCLINYIESVRPMFNINQNSPFFFLNKNGTQMKRNNVWKRFKIYTDTLGLEKRVHSLRHTFATDLLRGGASIEVVSALMGHSNLGVTSIYTHPTEAELRRAHSNFFGKKSSSYNDYCLV